MSMSWQAFDRVYFKFMAPGLIAAAGIFFVLIAPWHKQHLLIDFFVLYYALIFFSQWRFGKPTAPPASLQLRKLDPETFTHLQNIALQEYQYIQETMAQAMDDRHTLINYFLLTAGVMIAAIGGIYSQEGMQYSPYKKHITIALCLIFCFVAWIYLLKIVRLRQAWCESCAAMNRIKEFFLINTGVDDEETSPFFWKTATIPRAARKGNLFHLEVVLISFLASVTIGVVSVLLSSAHDWRATFGVPIFFFILSFFLLTSAYSIFLKEQPVRITQRTSHALRAEILAQRPTRVLIKKEETILQDFFTVHKATLQFEKYNGPLSPEIQRLNLVRGQSSAILLFDEAEHEFVFVEQFRYPAYDYNRESGWLIEVIAGIVDEGETPRATALREAREETGYEVEKIEKLTEFYVSPGGSSERVFVFWGKLGSRTGKGGGNSSEAEDIRLVRIPVPLAYQLLDEGFFEDAKTIVALRALYSRVQREV